MRRTLLIAQGTFQNPFRETLVTALGLSITLTLGLVALRLPTSEWLGMVLVAVILVTAAVLKARFAGPREFRVEKPADGGMLRVTGQFDNGSIPASQPVPLREARVSDNELVLEVDADTELAAYRVARPAFSGSSMTLLAELIGELRDSEPDALQERYRGRGQAVRAYDARGLLLLRFAQKPGYMPLTWSIAAATVVLWLMALGLFRV